MIVFTFVKICIAIVLGIFKAIGAALAGLGIGVGSIMKNRADKNNN